MSEILRLLHDDGWRLAATRGSHRQYKHPAKPGRVTVAGKRNEFGACHAQQYPETGRPLETAMRYAVVIEKAGSNFCAYVPDLPGCVATGASLEDAEREIRDAIVFHLAGLREDRIAAPIPTSHVKYVEITA